MRTFAFDRMPVQKHGDEARADLILEAPPSLVAGPGMTAGYALVVEPGEYALSSSQLKAARSASDVATYAATRSRLIRDGQPLAGTFKVGAGELVYIGHFGLDCVDGQPTIWRYYITNREGFQQYLAGAKAKYPFLNTEKAQYRLFETNVIGHNYELR